MGRTAGAVETAFCECRPPCQEVQTKTQRKAKLQTQVGQEQRASQLALDISETERKKEAAKDNLDFIARHQEDLREPREQ